jgi:hypothetical protein
MSGNKSKNYKFKINKMLFKVIILSLVLGTALGLLYGYHKVNILNHRHIYDSGYSVCNGDLFTGNLITQEQDDYISLYYQADLIKGKVSFILYNPEGSIVLEYNDWESVLHQKSVKLNDSNVGTWYYKLVCDKAELNYILELEASSYNYSTFSS